MPAEAELTTDYDALSEFIVNCPELAELESLLGGFNIFQVLGFEYGEIRHSNVLAWLLDPSESHGLDDTFLQAWLKRVLHDAPVEASITPVDVHCWTLANVEVMREWQHIDLLLVFTMTGGEQWVVAVENKVNSTQHSDQLSRYRRIVESQFRQARHRLYLFLTKNDEEPEDDAYLPATYAQVHDTLKECVAARGHAIGSEPRVLIENYLRLIEEKFMNESDIAILAQKIYKKHKRALEIIYEQRPDNFAEMTTRVEALVAERAEPLGFIPIKSEKCWVRFMPRDWDQPGNRHGTAIKGVEQSVVLEISLLKEGVHVQVCDFKTPKEWSERIWARSQDPPFENPRKGRKPFKHGWNHIHRRRLDVSVDWDDVIEDPDQLADDIVTKAFEEVRKPAMQEIIQIISSEIPALDEAYRGLENPE